MQIFRPMIAWLIGIAALVLVGIAALTFVFGVVILNSNEISFYVWACVGLVLIYALRAVISWLFGIAIALLMANIIVSNDKAVSFELMPDGEWMIPLGLIILGVFCIGLLLGGLILYPRLIASQFREGILSHELAQLEAQQNKNETQNPWGSKDKNND